jgi:hypothetical protein
MTQMRSLFRVLLVSLTALALTPVVQAQVVESSNRYTLTVEHNSSDCDEARNVGELCGPELNIVYLGEGISGRKLFTTLDNLSSTAWNNAATSSILRTNIMSGVLGAQNTATLAVTDSNGASGFQPHLAAQACHNLTYGGFSDWYLPASAEAYALFEARAHLNGGSSTVWTSTETDQTNARAFNIGTGALLTSTKSTARPVRCVRGGSEAVVATKSCDTVSSIGENCGTGRVVYAGESLSGRPLYTTRFLLPATFWNDGLASSTSIVRTNVSSPTSGWFNTDNLLDSNTVVGVQPHDAAEICRNMSYGGYSDWYLPASHEAAILHQNRSSLQFQSGVIWTSSERDQYEAFAFDIGAGTAISTSKWFARAVQCVRRGPAPVVTQPDCGEVTTVGGTCGTGGIVFAGEGPSGRMFTTSFSLPSTFWNDGLVSSTSIIRTNVDKPSAGSANTASLAAADANNVTGFQRHLAASVCQNMTYGGYSDWFLPGSHEAEILHRNRDLLPVKSGVIWTSTERDQYEAISFDIGTGATASTSKWFSRAVQCVRADPAPNPAIPCESVTGVGQTCGDGTIVYAGEAHSGRPLYTTSFLMPSAFWNDGLVSSTSILRNNVSSPTAGWANTATLAVTDANNVAGFQTHMAAAACEGMRYGGYSDWYLPSTHEASILHRNRALLPVKSGVIWTSSERDQYEAFAFDIGAGTILSSSKWIFHPVQCVRRGPTPVVAEPDCGEVTTIGGTCGTGGIVFAGEGASGRMFTTSFSLPSTFWNDGLVSSTSILQTNIDSPINGAANTASLAAADASAVAGIQRHLAASVCQNMTYGGYSDWFLPGSHEAEILHRNRDLLPVKSGVIWTSTERDQYEAISFDIGTGATASTSKWFSRAVQCVRADPAAPTLETPCESVTGIGQSCGDGTIVYAGEAHSGRPLYTTTFLMPSAFWNDGLVNSTNIFQTNVSSPTAGWTNSSTLTATDASAVSGFQAHMAASICTGITYGGYSDWYLPASHEAAILHRNRDLLPVQSGVIWTSSERDRYEAFAFDIGAGTAVSTSKWLQRAVQCVRRGPAPVVTQPDCGGVTTVGGTCGTGGIVFAGEGPAGRMFTTGFSLPSTFWNDGLVNSTNIFEVNVGNPSNGSSNTASLSAADASAVSGFQRHLAASVCQNMTYGGYSDWFLPGSHEAEILYRNRDLLPVKSGVIWTSTERDRYEAISFDIGAGATASTSKWFSRAVQCVRADPAAPTPETPCESVTGIGQTCGDGTIVYAGEAHSGRPLYTTTFLMPDTFWNDGLVNSTNIFQTNVSSPTFGWTNTATLAVTDASAVSGFQAHKAASACEGMRYGGYSDWYLPSTHEAGILHRNRDLLPVKSGVIWTSSERDRYEAFAFDIGAGTVLSSSKWISRPVQCVRRGPEVIPAETSCDPIRSIGQTCGDGTIISAGIAPSGHPIFTTTTGLPSTFWNDGLVNSTNTPQTNVVSRTDGRSNTTTLRNADASGINGFQRYLAAHVCDGMTLGGYSDWYLPAVDEALEIHRNIGQLPFSTGAIWTSTESARYEANTVNLSTGATTSTSKWLAREVRCVRSPTYLVVALLPDQTLRTGPVGSAWSRDLSLSLQVNGGTVQERPARADFTWSVISGQLPDGISLNASNGLISGTPEKVGGADIRVRAEHFPSGVFVEADIRIETSSGTEFVLLNTLDIPPGYTVSEDQLTLTNNGLSTNYQRWMMADVRIPQSDQTYYWEVALSGGSNSWGGYVGVVSQFGESQYGLDSLPIWGDSIGYRGDGSIWGDGSEGSGTQGTSLVAANATWAYGNGDVLRFAFNPLSGALWVGKNGTWRNAPTGAPTFDINGAIDFASPYAIPSLQARTAAGESLTLLSSPSQFLYAVPSGALPLSSLIDRVPDPFSFTGFTDVEPSVLLTTGPVQITGINNLTPISVTPGAEYRINTGAWTSDPGQVGPGQNVSVRLTSGAFGETVTATLDIGGVSASVSATTRAQRLEAAPFGWAAIENAAPGSVIISNAVVLSGPDAPAPISITGAGAEFQINGAEFRTDPGIVSNGDVIHLRVTAPIAPSETVEAVLTVGTVSGIWRISTPPNCDEVSIPGARCGDSQIFYAGEATSGGALFATTYLLPMTSWNDGATSYTRTNRDDPVNGAANTTALSSLDANSAASGTQAHLAATACSSLDASGHSDWYLPSLQEAFILRRVGAALPFTPVAVWTSTETDISHAVSYNLNTGATTHLTSKNTSLRVVCVRKGTAQISDSGIVHVGESLSGGALYAAPFLLPPSFWNDSATSYIRTNRDDPVDGAGNSAFLSTADANSAVSLTQIHMAAASCDRMSYGGHSDWYLPSVQEAVILHRNRTQLPFSAGLIWTSTETDLAHAASFNVGTGAVNHFITKNTTRSLICVRKDPVPLDEPDVVYVGESLSGGALYATPFLLAPSFWNDSGTGYVRTNRNDPVDGAANTAALMTIDSSTATGVQAHMAAASCGGMTYGGHSDWYLPAAQEAVVLRRNASALPVSPGVIWTSTEMDTSHAVTYDVGTGTTSYFTPKITAANVICVRKDPAPLGEPDVVYMGETISGGALYATPFLLSPTFWNDSGTGYVRTNRDDPVNGAANTAALMSMDSNSVSGIQPHMAAEACGRLSYGGYSDWYLPSVQEAVILHRNRTQLPFSAGQIWTSTETDVAHAASFNVGTGAVNHFITKNTTRSLICVRKDPVPLDEPDVVYVGESLSGGALYATPFLLAPSFWNDSGTGYVRTNRDDPVNGAANTTALMTLDSSTASGVQAHMAAASCGRLTYGGHSDWYLPAAQEAVILRRNASALPVTPGVIWTSTETDVSHAITYDVGTGTTTHFTPKNEIRAILCVRKDPIPLDEPDVVYVGESVSGGALYATPFLLAPTFWNDSGTGYVRTNRDDPVNGAANTAALMALDSSTVTGVQAHMAAASCGGLSYGGHSDWYLPSVQEANVLHRNRTQLPFSAGQIWTSTETDVVHAASFNVGTGAVNHFITKNTARSLICVRKDPVPLDEPDVVYVGESLSGGALYATPFLLTPSFWNDSGTGYVRTNRDDPVNGAANTAALMTLDSSTVTGVQTHMAAASCGGMTYGGHSDWYLPSVHEALILRLNASALPVSPGVIWTSTETDVSHATSYNVGTGTTTHFTTKNTVADVLCVRRDPVPVQPLTPCKGNVLIGTACGGGDVVYAGVAPNDEDLFATSFLFAPSFWNDGGTGYVNTNRRDASDGAANTAGLVSLDASTVTGVQAHMAAATCGRLNYGGYSDWYLPATNEVAVLRENRNALPVKSGLVWTSTETASSTAVTFNIGTGTINTLETKNTARSLICVRSQSKSLREPVEVFNDGFEAFTGWNQLGTGRLAASTGQTRSGSVSALKSFSGDPSGAFKLLDAPVWRNYELEAWIRSSDPRIGGAADRIAVLDADGNGYGPNIGPSSHALDVRTGYVANGVGDVGFTRPQNAWYRVLFRAFPDNTFRTTIYNEAGDVLSSQDFAADTTHPGPFDRVAILGGYEYHIDDVTVRSLDPFFPTWDTEVNRFKTTTRNPRDLFAWAQPAFLNNAVIARDASVTDSPLGGQPLRMTPTGADPHIGTYNNLAGQQWNLAPAAEGETWEVRVFVKGSEATSAQLFLFGTTSAGVWNPVSGTVGARTFPVSTEWQELVYRYTFAHPSVQAVQVRLDGPEGGEPVQIWFDGLQLYKIR